MRVELRYALKKRRVIVSFESSLRSKCHQIKSKLRPKKVAVARTSLTSRFTAMNWTGSIFSHAGESILSAAYRGVIACGEFAFFHFNDYNFTIKHTHCRTGIRKTLFLAEALSTKRRDRLAAKTPANPDWNVNVLI